MMIGVNSGTRSEMDSSRTHGEEIARHVQSAINSILQETGYDSVVAVSAASGEPEYIPHFKKVDHEIIKDLVIVGVMSHRTTEEFSEEIVGVAVFPGEPLFDSLTYHDDGHVEKIRWRE